VEIQAAVADRARIGVKGAPMTSPTTTLSTNRDARDRLLQAVASAKTEPTWQRRQQAAQWPVARPRRAASGQ
jgi:hypothetical protein